MYGNIQYGIVILAGGNSSRMGEPKQLLAYNGTTLLLNAVDHALQLNDAVVTVVTGAANDMVEEQLAGKNVDIQYNAAWESGMASSIRSGVSSILQNHPFIDAVIITVCDQPFLNTELLVSLIDAYHTTDKGIAASAYDNTIGTPVLFSSKYFNELMALEGQEGAKKIIAQNPDDVITNPFAKGGVDIDTPEDYQRLSN